MEVYIRDRKIVAIVAQLTKVAVLLRNSNTTKTWFQNSPKTQTKPQLRFRNSYTTKTDIQLSQLQQKRNSQLAKVLFDFKKGSWL